QLLTDLLTDRACHKRGGRKARLILGNIEISLVERQSLYLVCVTLEDLPYASRNRPISSEIRCNEDRLWTYAFGAHCWHGRARVETPGLVRSSADGRAIAPPGDDHGLAPQV